MAYWMNNELQTEFLVQDIPWLNEDKFTVTITRGSDIFTVRIAAKAESGLRGSMAIKMFEQQGCCGYANIKLPNCSNLVDDWVKGKQRGDLYLQVVKAMAGRVCATGVQFVGTELTWLFPAMKRHRWKLVHRMPNRRYQQRGSMLYVWCVNYNTFTKAGKPLFPRKKKASIYE